VTFQDRVQLVSPYCFLLTGKAALTAADAPLRALAEKWSERQDKAYSNDEVLKAYAIGTCVEELLSLLAPAPNTPEE
jgi:hypothetical protein